MAPVALRYRFLTMTRSREQADRIARARPLQLVGVALKVLQSSTPVTGALRFQRFVRQKMSWHAREHRIAVCLAAVTLSFCFLVRAELIAIWR